MRLTEQVIQATEQAATVGVPEKFIFGELDIPERTWLDWKQRGKAIELDLAEGRVTEEDLGTNERLYLRFSRSLEKGFSAGVKAALGRIRSAGKRQWQAEAWYLERRWPDLFGRYDRRNVKLEADVRSRSSIDVSKLKTDTLERIAEELEALDDDKDES